MGEIGFLRFLWFLGVVEQQFGTHTQKNTVQGGDPQQQKDAVEALSASSLFGGGGGGGGGDLCEIHTGRVDMGGGGKE